LAVCLEETQSEIAKLKMDRSAEIYTSLVDQGEEKVSTTKHDIPPYFGGVKHCNIMSGEFDPARALLARKR
jgi:hypothetical protein